MDASLRMRNPRDDEFLAYGHAMEKVFLEAPSEEQIERWRSVCPLDRFLAVTDPAGAHVGTAGSFPMSISMPDADPVPCAGVTAVTVRPDHGRRGILREMMQRLLDDAVAAGEPVAALFASEAPSTAGSDSGRRRRPRPTSSGATRWRPSTGTRAWSNWSRPTARRNCCHRSRPPTHVCVAGPCSAPSRGGRCGSTTTATVIPTARTAPAGTLSWRVAGRPCSGPPTVSVPSSTGGPPEGRGAARQRPRVGRRPLVLPGLGRPGRGDRGVLPPRRTPDVVLPTTTLATLFLGGYRATTLADAGRLPGTAAEVVGRLDRLFAVARAPWTPFDF